MDDRGNYLPTKSEAYFKILDVLRSMAATGELGLAEINSIESELRDARRKGQREKAKMDPSYLEKQKKALEKAAATRQLSAPSPEEKERRKQEKAAQDKERKEWEKSKQRLETFDLSKFQKTIKFVTTPNVVEGLPQGETISGLDTADFKRLVQFTAAFQKAFTKGSSGYAAKDIIGRFDPGDVALTLQNVKRVKPKDPNTNKGLTMFEDSLDTMSSALSAYKSIKPRPQKPTRMVPSYDRWSGEYTGQEPEAPDPWGDWSSMQSYEYSQAYIEIAEAVSQMMVGMETLEKARDFKNFT